MNNIYISLMVLFGTVLSGLFALSAKRSYKALESRINMSERKTPSKAISKLEMWLNSPSKDDRLKAVKYSYKLDKLINDPDAEVRAEVAKMGYRLDKFINDPSFLVRVEVAKHGYALDELINDRSHFVRKAVAEQGYGIDQLKQDNSVIVRETVEHVINKSNVIEDDEDDFEDDCDTFYMPDKDELLELYYEDCSELNDVDDPEDLNL